MGYQHSSTTDLDELVGVLADQRCRSVLRYFRGTESAVATVADLASAIDEQTRTGGKREARLHHVTLPRLDDAGIVEYDPRSTTVRYQGHPKLEMLIDSIAELQTTGER